MVVTGGTWQGTRGEGLMGHDVEQRSSAGCKTLRLMVDKITSNYNCCYPTWHSSSLQLGLDILPIHQDYMTSTYHGCQNIISHMNINILSMNITNRRGDKGHPYPSPTPVLIELNCMPRMSMSCQAGALSQHLPLKTLGAKITTLSWCKKDVAWVSKCQTFFKH